MYTFKHTDKFLLGTAFWIKGARNLVLPAVEETSKFAVQLKKDKKMFLHIQKESMEELLRMDTMISFPLLVMPI